MYNLGMELQVGVKVLLKRSDGKYLLVKRSRKKYPDVSGSWDIVGGRIIVGESLISNLRREVKEETGLEINGEPRLVAAQDILRVAGKHVVRLTYVARARGKVKLDKEENEGFGWFSPKELKILKDADVYLKEILGKLERASDSRG